MRLRSLFLAASLLSGLSLAAAPAQAQSSPKALLPDLPLPILQSLSYVDIEPGRTVTLSDGMHQDDRRTLRLEPSLVAHGDLDHDGTRDAAVLIEQRVRDVPTLYLSVVVQRAGRVRNMASLLLGEHVQVRSLSIENRIVLLSLLVLGEGDAAARPTLQMTLGLKLDGSELQIMRQEPRGRFTAVELAGTSWKLAEAPWPVTAEFALANDGSLRLTGRAPCHHWSAGVAADGAVQAVTRGGLLGTRRLCSPEMAAAERDFLAALGATETVAFRFGRLALAGAGGGAMLWHKD